MSVQDGKPEYGGRRALTIVNTVTTSNVHNRDKKRGLPAQSI